MKYCLVIEYLKEPDFDFHLLSDLDKALRAAKCLWLLFSPAVRPTVKVYVYEVSQLFPPVFGKCELEISVDKPFN